MTQRADEMIAKRSPAGARAEPPASEVDERSRFEERADAIQGVAKGGRARDACARNRIDSINVLKKRGKSPRINEERTLSFAS